MRAHEPATGVAAPRPVLRVRRLGMQPYPAVLDAMRELTDHRGEEEEDELWLVQHPALFTLGQAGRREHLLSPGNIPVVQSDRGGQVTFHGPGQIVAYALVDLRRARLGVRDFVHLLEESVLDLLLEAGLRAERRRGAPGVYLDGAKIAALGLRVRRGCTYHGLSLNVSLDLEPFSRIDACGFPGLRVTRLSDHGVDWTLEEAADRLAEALAARLECRADFRPASHIDVPPRTPHPLPFRADSSAARTRRPFPPGPGASHPEPGA